MQKILFENMVHCVSYAQSKKHEELDIRLEATSESTNLNYCTNSGETEVKKDMQMAREEKE